MRGHRTLVWGFLFGILFMRNRAPFSEILRGEIVDVRGGPGIVCIHGKGRKKTKL